MGYYWVLLLELCLCLWNFLVSIVSMRAIYIFGALANMFEVEALIRAKSTEGDIGHDVPFTSESGIFCYFKILITDMRPCRM